jgi:hypothetical protein
MPVQKGASIIVTPSKEGFSFSPTSKSYISLSKDTSLQIYSATDIQFPTVVITRPLNNTKILANSLSESLFFKITDNYMKGISKKIDINRPSSIQPDFWYTYPYAIGDSSYRLAPQLTFPCRVRITVTDINGNIAMDTVTLLQLIPPNIQPVKNNLSKPFGLNINGFNLLINLDRKSNASLSVYNALGHKIDHQVYRNSIGRIEYHLDAPTGVYMAVLTRDSDKIVRLISLMK